MQTTASPSFEPATAIYLSLYLLTLLVHVVFMNYVLAGAAYLGIVSLLPIQARASWISAPTASLLRDWLPFMLGAAITAGVAPLLFAQILYKHAFYTANLLLFHRWMAIVPVLIGGFYLLYLGKSRPDPLVPGWRRWVAPAAMLCIAFTGFSWTENHLLSLDEPAWPNLYGSGAMSYGHPTIWPRFAMWFAGAVPTMCLVIAGQLRASTRYDQAIMVGESRRLARLSWFGLFAATVAALWYHSWMDDADRTALRSSPAVVFLVVAAVGMAAQWAGWLAIASSDHRGVRSGWWWLTTAGLLLTLLGAAVTREIVRLAATDLAVLRDGLLAAAGVGGFPVFVIFAIINAAVIFVCLRAVRKGKQLPAHHLDEPAE